MVDDDETDGREDVSHQESVSVRVEVNPIAEERSLPGGSFKKKIGFTKVKLKMNEGQVFKVHVDQHKEWLEGSKRLRQGTSSGMSN